jgi:hypothetical protein
MDITSKSGAKMTHQLITLSSQQAQALTTCPQALIKTTSLSTFGMA